MNISLYIQIITALGVIGAAGIAAFTAYLNYRQIRFQFKPNLFIGSAQYQIHTSNKCLRNIWWEKPSEKAIISNGGSTDYQFNLLNTGAGSAHDIRIETFFDYESIIHDVIFKIKKYCPNINIEHDDWGIQIKLNGELYGGFRYPKDSYALIDYISSSNNNKVEKDIIIDPTLSFCFLCYAFYLMSERVINGINHSNKDINVDFLIKYKDSSGNINQKIHRSVISIHDGLWKKDMSDGVTFISIQER
ncbi:hypothetical protein [Fodinicurvata fenggangensis]|uniref:hypothetical protein n=1 Tax=Fodinicurvata fenggangensis TaxID=1121830 RepID=UPI0012DC5B33|nr:hypothetical protein [Fodinicurvata fenggangensis]